MPEMLLLGFACLALIGALLLARSRWPVVAWGGVLLMLFGGVLWPAIVYVGADQQAGPFSEAAWPPGAVSTVAAWAGMLVGDLLGLLALACAGGTKRSLLTVLVSRTPVR